MLECIEKTQDAVLKITGGEDPFISRPVKDQPQKRRAWGFAVTFKNTGLGEGAPDNASAEIELLEDGIVETRISSAEIGQGLVTVLQMVTAEELNLPIGQVRVYLSDTDLTPNGGPTTGSRQTYISGNAAKFAAITLRNSMLATLSEKYNQPPEKITITNGIVKVNGQELTFAETRRIYAGRRKSSQIGL